MSRASTHDPKKLLINATTNVINLKFFELESTYRLD